MLFYEISIRYSEPGILARDFYVSTNGRLLRQGKRVIKVNDAFKDIGNLSNRIAKDSNESQDLANAIQAKSVQLNSLTSAWEINIKAAEQRNKLSLAAKREKAFS